MASSRPIYLDYNASTPLAPEVLDAMTPFLTSAYGNPSTTHWAGVPAKQALEHARAEVAALLNATPNEIVFTSGGSEANNAALVGLFFKQFSAGTGREPHVVTTVIEHPAILAPCQFLESLGARVTRLPVDSTGGVDPDEVRRALTSDTVLVSVMHANNEVGTIEPITEIARVTRSHGVLFHTDAAQSVGKIPTRVTELGVDLLSVAGHKVYAPKGVGALYVRSGVVLEPLIHGAGHEQNRRAGTESVLLAVGLGAACRLAREQPCGDHLASLSTHFRRQLETRFGDRIVLNGTEERCLPNTINVSFRGHVGQDILDRLDGVAASTGSACHTGFHTMSPVLAAMGCSEDVGVGAIRFSVGRQTTREEVDIVLDRLASVVLTAP